ncbi:ABC transporter substrate-binding protein [Schaalia sp. lx-260]|uniref:ABC transporter substrate-binding protein n=1 Tax=Schaalia sp. lx-260 TaxID=2899082 RepID=UPI001E3694C0|nr:sugar ABC transporter substrate-binding protein [Schaalia sp. lx-260]MCD4550162.1 sugar ABC transporter substrate-binding protein [Schaalia sp. lx-260]
MSRRVRGISFVAATACAAMLLTSCAGGGSGSSNGNASAQTDKVSITWDMWGGDEKSEKWVKDTAEIARKQNPDIEIKTQTASWGDYFTKLTANASSGNLACVTSMNGQRLNTFYQTLSPLSEDDLRTAGINPADFTQGALDILSYDGKLYGIPYDVAAMLVYYNKDMFAETGTPEPRAQWNFDDFLAAAKSTTTDAHKGFGVGMGEFQWMALPIAKSGVQPVTKQNKLDLTNPDFLEAAQWYAKLVTEEKVADPVPSASELGWGEEQYQAGNVAMAVDGTWNAKGYFTNEAGFKAGAQRLPQGKNGSYALVLGSGFGIAANCQGAEREAALKVLGSLLSKDAQDLLASSGRSYPARTESQPLYFEALPEEIRGEVKTAFEAVFTGLTGQNSASTWQQVNEYFTPNLVSVYTGAMNISDMLASAQSQFGN